MPDSSPPPDAREAAVRLFRAARTSPVVEAFVEGVKWAHELDATLTPPARLEAALKTSLLGHDAYGESETVCPTHEDGCVFAFYADHHVDLSWRCWECFIGALPHLIPDPEGRVQALEEENAKLRAAVDTLLDAESDVFFGLSDQGRIDSADARRLEEARRAARALLTPTAPPEGKEA